MLGKRKKIQPHDSMFQTRKMKPSAQNLPKTENFSKLSQKEILPTEGLGNKKISDQKILSLSENRDQKRKDGYEESY